MVKVIGQSQEFVKNITCKHCSSVLEYREVDVKIDKHKDYLGDVTTVKYISCPVCDNPITINVRTW